MLNLTVCALRSAIGEYNVYIEKDEAYFQDLASPTILALANNTKVDHAYKGGGVNGHPSTLAGILGIMFNQWDSEVYIFPQGGRIIGFTAGGGDSELFMKPNGQKCVDWKDPTRDILVDYNRLMVYTGALAARSDVPDLESRLDPGIIVNTTIVGTLDGSHNVFKTDYWYFLGAAILELVCVALIAPTLVNPKEAI